MEWAASVMITARVIIDLTSMDAGLCAISSIQLMPHAGDTPQGGLAPNHAYPKCVGYETMP
jgi:hypothetical protein